MPDPAPTPNSEAPNPQPEAVELAKGLPGLPIDAGWVRVSEDGFIRAAGMLCPARFIPWDSVRGVNRGLFGIELLVLGDGANGRKRDRIVIHSSPGRLAAVETAWWEYRTRMLQRDGNLSGGVFPLRSTLDLVSTIVGGLLVSVAIAVFLICGRLPDPLAFFQLFLAIIAVSSLCGSLETAGYLLRKRWVERLWSKWRLDAAGITHADSEGERTLQPGAGDSAGRGVVRIDGERVPVNGMHYGRVAAAMLLALATRAGASLRTAAWSRVHTVMTVRMIFGMSVLSFVLAMRFGWQQTLEGLLVIAPTLGVMLAMFATVGYFSAGRELRRLLTHGRAMLERLGW